MSVMTSERGSADDSMQGGSGDAVDIYDGTTRSWSTARLSRARFNLAAASLPIQGLAFFAGGESELVLTKQPLLLLTQLPGDSGYDYDVVDVYDANKRTWATARLSVGRYGLAATSLPSQGLVLFAGGVGDVFASLTVVCTMYRVFLCTSCAANGFHVLHAITMNAQEMTPTPR